MRMIASVSSAAEKHRFDALYLKVLLNIYLLTVVHMTW